MIALRETSFRRCKYLHTLSRETIRRLGDQLLWYVGMGGAQIFLGYWLIKIPTWDVYTVTRRIKEWIIDMPNVKRNMKKNKQGRIDLYIPTHKLFCDLHGWWLWLFLWTIVVSVTCRTKAHSWIIAKNKDLFNYIIIPLLIL